MIDTVSITIYQPNYSIDPNFRMNTAFEKGCTRKIYNPNKQQKAEYGYLPRITEFKAVREGGYSNFLKIEFSIPKLIYGNNFDEVEEKDFDEICNQLQNKLSSMYINIPNIDSITNADVSTIHYSKNIILTDYTTPYMYLEKLKKCNIRKSFDINNTDYRNEGHAFKFHSNSFEIVFYDKLKDLEKSKISEKKSIEKDNYTQLNLFSENTQKTPFEVLRIEVRIGDRTKLKQILKKYGFENKERTFSEMFSKEISKKILLETIKDCEETYPQVIENEQTMKDLAINLLINEPNLSHTQFMKYLSGIALIQEVGIREFREITEKFGKNQWYRFNKDFKKINFNNKIEVFKTFRMNLEKFQTIKLENYREKM